MKNQNIFNFSPSEFAFGYAGCKRCYYDQKVNNIKVSLPFPSVFSKLDILQKNFYHDKSSDLLGGKIAPGVIKTDYSKTQKSKILEETKRLAELWNKVSSLKSGENCLG